MGASGTPTSNGTSWEKNKLLQRQRLQKEIEIQNRRHSKKQGVWRGSPPHRDKVPGHLFSPSFWSLSGFPPPKVPLIQRGGNDKMSVAKKTCKKNNDCTQNATNVWAQLCDKCKFFLSEPKLEQCSLTFPSTSFWGGPRDARSPSTQARLPVLCPGLRQGAM